MTTTTATMILQASEVRPGDSFRLPDSDWATCTESRIWQDGRRVRIASDTGPVRWVSGATPAEVERDVVDHPEPDPAFRQARLEREAKARVRSRDIIGKASR